MSTMSSSAGDFFEAMQSTKTREDMSLLERFVNSPVPLTNIQDHEEQNVDGTLSDCIRYLSGEEVEAMIKSVARTGYKDELKIDEDGKPLLRRTTSIHLAAKSKFPNRYNIIGELFKIFDKFDVNYTDESGLTHFHVACSAGCDEVVTKFLELGQDPNLLVRKTGDSPLHLAVKNEHEMVALMLLKHGADPNLVNGSSHTPLHVIGNDDLLKLVLKIGSDDKHRKVQIDARDKFGYTPLNLAVRYSRRDLAETLLRHGANANSVNVDDSTPLHIIALRKKDDDLAEEFLRICDDVKQTVQVDARNTRGATPLHIALRYGNKITAAALLRRGADPNVTCPEGWTPLHFIASHPVDDGLVESFFKTNEDLQQKVKVDVANDLGSTPLHFALRHGNKIAAEALLRRGANPNAVNANGWRPLHFIAMQHNVDDDMVKKFFEIVDEQQQQVLIDAQDKWGQTALRDAVASLSSGVVDVLLNRGADLSKFVFPTEISFGKTFKRSHGEQCYDFKCRLGFQALAVVRSLKSRGYQLSSRDALTVMKFFIKHGLFEESANTDEYCDYDETRLFNDKQKELMISPNLSLYNLTQLGIAEMAKRFTDALCA
uniref:Uncharacterized protein n=1 Tax=Trichogramma kaykai TaxID=54128 RepID=A0ABD2X6G6_9HYME